MKFSHIGQPRMVERSHDHTVSLLQRLSKVANVSLILVAAGFWLMIGFTAAYAAVPVDNRPDGVAALALQGRYDALRDQLAANSFNRPVALESSLNANDVKGDIYAVVPSSFEKVSAALSGPQGWCEILILHLNTKYCGIAHEQQGTALLMNIGKKFDQPLADSYRLHFAWRLADQNAAFLRVVLSADTGPLSTRDYRITLEAVPLANGATFLHLSYAYGFGLSGKIAMLAYFATTGRNKVGFSVTGTGADGQPAYIDGMRGLVERNTMRYYLAIESFLGSLATPVGAQFEKRINDWFTAIERYPLQLHEMEQTEYLDMKRKEYRRQQLGDGEGNAGQG